MSDRETAKDTVPCGLGVMLVRPGGVERIDLPIYTPDPAEEAYYSSPEGKRATARLLRESAARKIAEAEKLEAEASANVG